MGPTSSVTVRKRCGNRRPGVERERGDKQATYVLLSVIHAHVHAHVIRHHSLAVHFDLGLRVTPTTTKTTKTTTTTGDRCMAESAPIIMGQFRREIGTRQGRQGKDAPLEVKAQSGSRRSSCCSGRTRTTGTAPGSCSCSSCASGRSSCTKKDA